MTQRPDSWDENCSYNIDDIGVDFMPYLDGFDFKDDEYINGIYSGLIRFLCEYDLNNSSNRLSGLFSSIKKRVLDNLSILENGREKEEILFALYEMPIKMLKTLMNNKDIKSFVSIENNIKELENQKNELDKTQMKWSQEIDFKRDEVNKLKDKLDGYKIDLNFVALNKGFEKLYIKKWPRQRLYLKH